MSDYSHLDKEALDRIRRRPPQLRDEQARLEEKRLLPATRGDIDRLTRALETGWIGRGFAIGFGVAVLNILLAFVGFAIWTSNHNG